MLVSSNAIESQEELLVELDKAGCPCGQATLSRDLKLLRISKVRIRNGRSIYALPREGQFVPAPTPQEVKDMKWGIAFSGNIMVIHTPPGHASMVAYDIDNAHSRLVLGTVAGDDTIFVVLAEDADRDEVRGLVNDTIPSLHGKVFL